VGHRPASAPWPAESGKRVQVFTPYPGRIIETTKVENGLRALLTKPDRPALGLAFEEPPFVQRIIALYASLRSE
jgi:hypothetical protein